MADVRENKKFFAGHHSFPLLEPEMLSKAPYGVVVLTAKVDQAILRQCTFLASDGIEHSCGCMMLMFDRPCTSYTDIEIT